LKAQEATVSECSDESCAVRIGQLLSADQIFLGNVSKIGTKIIVTVKLIDIEKGRSLRAENVEDTTLEGLTNEMPVLANSLAGGQASGGQGKIIVEEETGPEATSAAPAAGAVKEISATVLVESDPDGVSFKLYDAAGRLLGEGITPKAFRLSAASYSVQASDSQKLYYPFKESFTVSREGRLTFRMELKPNFGGLALDSDPTGADALLNGIRIGATPYRQEKLKSGVYELLVRKDLYESKSVTVKVEDGKTAQVQAVLVSAFITLSVSEAKGLPATLYLDGARAGRLPVNTKIPFRDFELRVVPDDPRYGEYTEKVSARSRGQQIERKVALEGRFGSVWVTTEPFLRDGKIYADGKEVGAAGDEFNLLVGEYELSAKGMYKDQAYSGRQHVKVEEGGSVQVTLAVAPDKYQSVIEGWVNQLDSLSLLLQSKARISYADIQQAAQVLAGIRGAQYPVPEYAARAEVLIGALTTEKERQDRVELLAVLNGRLYTLRSDLESAKRIRSGQDTWGWVSLVTGAVLTGVSGYLWYLSEQAYGSYQASQVSADAVSLREQITRYDILKMISGVPGVIGLFASPILFIAGPKPGDLEKSIRDVEEQIKVVEGGGTLAAYAVAPDKPKPVAKASANQLLDMVPVADGIFQMGSTSGGSDELPAHSVKVSSFLISKYEVTQAQYQQVVGSNPSHFTGGTDAPKRPVEQVSWYDAVSFCNALSDREGFQKVYTINGTNVTADFSKNGYRLPTEAEWEYAARGGNQSRGYAYSGSNTAGDVAWDGSNSGETPHPVGTKAPNELGLFDMSGNVWEWCWDRYGSYGSAAQDNPPGPTSGTYRVLRGGSWDNFGDYGRGAGRVNSIGFRPVRRAGIP
jgi:formylglycine-generating enzyme required for sulfatase activity